MKRDLKDRWDVNALTLYDKASIRIFRLIFN